MICALPEYSHVNRKLDDQRMSMARRFRSQSFPYVNIRSQLDCSQAGYTLPNVKLGKFASAIGVSLILGNHSAFIHATLLQYMDPYH